MIDFPITPVLQRTGEIQTAPPLGTDSLLVN
jgi:hypothetical protein